jgi:hypothetical protein
MTKEQALESIRLIRNQLDKLPLDGDLPEGTNVELDNAYKLVYSIWEHIEENVK